MKSPWQFYFKKLKQATMKLLAGSGCKSRLGGAACLGSASEGGVGNKPLTPLELFQYTQRAMKFKSFYFRIVGLRELLESVWLKK